MPGADSCCGMQEPRTDRCDEDELIPFLREWNKLFKTNNQALSLRLIHTQLSVWRMRPWCDFPAMNDFLNILKKPSLLFASFQRIKYYRVDRWETWEGLPGNLKFSSGSTFLWACEWATAVMLQKWEARVKRLPARWETFHPPRRSNPLSPQGMGRLLCRYGRRRFTQMPGKTRHCRYGTAYQPTLAFWAPTSSQLLLQVVQRMWGGGPAHKDHPFSWEPSPIFAK